MTREQRKRLKELDELVLRCALPLQTAIIERAKLDRPSTLKLVEAITQTLTQCAEAKE